MQAMDCMQVFPKSALFFKGLSLLAVASLALACGAHTDGTDENVARDLDSNESALYGSPRTGYIVEVHTCDLKNAETDSTVMMTISARDVDWNPIQLGPWHQDQDYEEGYSGTYNDHERNHWDRYFFLHATQIYHIEDLILSFKRGNKGAWCWDKMYFTRVEQDQVGWTWEYDPGQTWLENNGDYHYAFRGGYNGHGVDVTSVVTPGTSPRITASNPSIMAKTFLDRTGYSPPCPRATFQLDGTGPTVSADPVGDLSHPYRCNYSALFPVVNPGYHHVSKRFDGDGSPATSCGVNVNEGLRASVGLSPFGGCY